MENQLDLFSKKLETCLVEYFPNYDFGNIIGHGKENVGKLKLKNSLFDIDREHC